MIKQTQSKGPLTQTLVRQISSGSASSLPLSYQRPNRET